METEDGIFLEAFESCTLPRWEWTHRAHLRMAYLYLRDGPDAAALLSLVRERIQTYNQANRNRTGYHETVTAVYLHLVADRLQCSTFASFTEFEQRNADLFAPGGAILLRHYRHETIFSPAARAAFVPPDREPLP